MGKHDKTLSKVLSGKSDYNIGLNDLVSLLLYKGFRQRIEGSHMVFTREGIQERLNIQSEGGKAKGYQVKQIRKIFIKYSI